MYLILSSTALSSEMDLPLTCTKAITKVKIIPTLSSAFSWVKSDIPLVNSKLG